MSDDNEFPRNDYSALTCSSQVKRYEQPVNRSCWRSLKNDHKISLCGNGGSTVDSQHIVTEIVGCIYCKETSGSASYSLNYRHFCAGRC